MLSPIEKEQKKKKLTKIYIIVAVICIFFASFYLFHNDAMKQNGRMQGAKFAPQEIVLHMFSKPLDFVITKDSLTTILLGVGLIGSLVMITGSQRKLKKHDNPDTVKGEAHMMNSKELQEYNMKFAAPLGKKEINGHENMIISKDIRLAIDNKGTRRNCNILVIGGSGAGKSRFFASPNILQYNANFVITDPSGEMLRDYGKALEDNGYQVKVFNLTDVYRSNRYNPFHYIKEEKDVFILVNTLIKNTTPPEGKAGDPFWENSEKVLLSALILYLWHTCEEEQQTFANVVKMLELADVDENDSSAESPLDLMFKELEKEDPDNLAVKQYKTFKLGAGKTLKSILISVGVRLESFKLSDISYLTQKDDFKFESFSDTKQALFVIIPTADTTFNFLVSMLYSQMFASLYTYAETTAEYGYMAKTGYDIIKVQQANSEKSSKKAEQAINEFIHNVKQGVEIVEDKEKKLFKVYTKNTKELVGWRGTKEAAEQFTKSLKNLKIEKCGNRCPNHVRLILDEFANIGQIPDFDQKLATMRKYEISCSIILQALSQLKDIYKDKWNTLVANCDTKLFLGCDDSETIEWTLKMLGKKTITVQNTSYQEAGKGSTSYNKEAHKLMTIDQITMMQDDECLVRIRGVRPYFGKKYELTEHPNYKYAKSVEGTFRISLSEGARKQNNEPLWKRQKRNALNVEKTKEAPKGQKDKKPDRVAVLEKTDTKEKSSNINENNRRAKNLVRREEGKRAKEDLVKLEAMKNEPEELTLEELCILCGFEDSTTEEEILEKVEGVLGQEQSDARKNSYAMAQ